MNRIFAIALALSCTLFACGGGSEDETVAVGALGIEADDSGCIADPALCEEGLVFCDVTVCEEDKCEDVSGCFPPEQFTNCIVRNGPGSRPVCR